MRTGLTRRSPAPGRVAVALGLVFLATAAARGQDAGALRLEGLVPVGGLNVATESWGTFGFTVENRGPVDRDARVLVFYPERPDVQFGRDFWVPAGARVTGWLPIGPAPAQRSATGREVKFLLYDRTGGDPHALPPAGDDRLRNRAVPYRKREPTTAVLLDAVVNDGDDPDPLAREDSPAHQAVLFARTFRLARGLSETLVLVADKFLPSTAETFDGVDQFVLAGNRLAADPLGRAALRHWVQQGGTLWVMLDLVDPGTVAPVLGDDLGFRVVGRTSLTTVRLRRAGEDAAEARELEKPVDFVRVALAGDETVYYEQDGWPAAFSVPVGRGKVVFTTLGGRGWHRPRGPRQEQQSSPPPKGPNGPPRQQRQQETGEPRAPFEHYPDLPVPLPPLDRLAAEIYPEPAAGGFRPDDFAPLLTAEVGYAVVGRGTAALLLGGFVLALAGVGLGLRRTRRPEAVGWLAPVAAAVAAGLFVALGVATRRAVPPTAGAAAVVDVAPGTGEGAATGLFAVYRPDSGPTRLGGEHGGIVELDPAGLEGQTRRRVQTDLGAWHWEGLSLPAGLRFGPFRAAVRTGPVAAVARFGPDGVEGRLEAGRFRDPADAVLLAPAAEPVAVRFGEGGTFAAGPGDVLAPGEFLTGAVLTDRQQRRQEVYRKLLANPVPKHLEGRDLLLAWAAAADVPFSFGGESRTFGESLLVVPLAFERPAAGTRVTVPRGFVPCHSVVQGRPRPVTPEGTRPTDVRLRFDLPPSVRPLAVERATLLVRLRAPGRRVSLAGFADGARVPLQETESPVAPIRVEVADPRLLRPDADGGLEFGLSIGERADASGATDVRRADTGDVWRIEAIGLEVVGRVGADR